MSKTHAGGAVAAELEKCGMIVEFIGGRAHVTAMCSTPNCDNTSTWSTNKLPQASLVKTKFRNRDWRVDKKRCQCPRCIKKERSAIGAAVFHVQDPPTKTRETETMPSPETLTAARSTASDTALAVGMASQPTDQARAAKRRAYELLLDHYDVEKKRYKADMSDQKIADTTGYAVAAVASLREADFGPAGPPPSIGNLKHQLTQLEAQLRTEEKKIEAAFDQIMTIGPKVQTCRDELDRLIAVHGWEDA